ncbi:MAG: porin family protein [Flavobacteriaceae bacterium]
MKVFFSVLITVGVTIGMYSQDKKVRFGFKGGINTITIAVKSDFNKIIDVQSQRGFQFGGFVYVPLSDSFAFQPEIIYTEQKYLYDFVGEFNLTKTSVSGKLGYIAIPLMMVYHPMNRLGIELGPQISVLNQHRVNETQDYGVFSDSENYSIDKKTESTEVAFSAGLSFTLSDHLRLSGRYSYSLGKLVEEEFFSKVDASIDSKSIYQLNIDVLF